MGKTYEQIDDKIRAWMQRQHMFFVGTAPLTKDGHVNLSPKGHDALRVLDERTLVYLDYGGSGVDLPRIRQHHAIQVARRIARDPLLANVVRNAFGVPIKR